MDITPFLAKHKLPLKYQYLSEQYFIPLAQDILAAKVKGQAMLVAVNGAQGSGKTTLADFLAMWVNNNTEFNSVALSIDDFYLSSSKRQQLATNVHPLFVTRGVPGTHDTKLMQQTLTDLLAGKTQVPLPQFNKQTDNPLPASEWSNNQKPIDIIFFEGWCVASSAQQPYQLLQPINQLEQQDDQEGRWRRCVNSCLANEYQSVFSLIDYTVMLKAPSFDSVFSWRLEQEQKLVSKSGTGKGTFNKQQLTRFIAHFERITRENLATMSKCADALILLDEQRDISSIRLLADEITQPIIFTDLDGTLLGHDNYECEAIKPFLATLSEHDIHVIFNTSKTFDEVTAIQQSLAHHQPFIVENGAAVYIPINYFAIRPIGCEEYKGYWRFCFTQSNQQLHKDLALHDAQFSSCYQFFSQMNTAEVSDLTGLSVAQSKLAQSRQYSDPIHFLGDDEQQNGFVELLTSLGYEVLIGGRFIHATKGNDKGKAQHWLLSEFKKAFNNPFTVIALGDSHNDVAMLKEADIAILINNPSSKVQSDIQQKAWQISDKPAPEGWIQEVAALTVIKSHLAAKQEQSHG